MSVMKSLVAASALALAGCIASAAAEPAEEVVVTDPADVLAVQVDAALRDNDREAYYALMKMDGVTPFVAEKFDLLARYIVEADIERVYIEPESEAFENYEYDGVTYGLNGEPSGMITIAFVPEPPATKETFSMRYAIEDGRAVILREVPLDD